MFVEKVWLNKKQAFVNFTVSPCIFQFNNW